MDIINPQNIAIFGIFAAIGAFWNQIRGFFSKIFSFFVRTDTISGFDNCRFFVKILFEKGKCIRWGNQMYVMGPWCHIKKYNTNYPYLFGINNFLLFFIGKTFVFVSPGNEADTIKVTYLFKTFDLKSHLENAWRRNVNFVAQSEKNASRHYVMMRGGQDSIEPYKTSSQDGGGNAPSNNTFQSSPNNTIFYSPNFLAENNCYIDIKHGDIGEINANIIKPGFYWQKPAVQLLNEIKFWQSKREWFQDRQIRWVRSALLSGPGGTGKTKATLEVAKKLNLPVHRLDISNMTNSEFNRAFESCPYESVVLIEDIDSVFNGRTNLYAQSTHSKQLLTFDCLINTINGVEERGGYFLIATANDIEKLDPVIKRPGRLDTNIEFGFLDKEGKKFLAKNILKGLDKEQNYAINLDKEMTIVEFQNFCIELALNSLNNSRS